MWSTTETGMDSKRKNSLDEGNKMGEKRGERMKRWLQKRYNDS
jgi:hypothetical protein